MDKLLKYIKQPPQSNLPNIAEVLCCVGSRSFGSCGFDGCLSGSVLFQCNLQRLARSESRDFGAESALLFLCVTLAVPQRSVQRLSDCNCCRWAVP